MHYRIIITGGSGFLGREICRIAGELEIYVISISRHGRPGGFKSQSNNVHWVEADIFDPMSWRIYLEGADALIHCIGIVEENPAHGITYEKMIFTSAQIVGGETRRANVPKFVFVSAGAAAPETPEAYMRMKMAAEGYLIHSQPDVSILRPGMIYGEERPETLEEYRFIKNLLNDPKVSPDLEENHPLHVRTVALAALECALGNTKKKILSVDDMEDLVKRVES